MTIFDLPRTGTDPFTLFSQWFEEAKSSEINDPEAMNIATVAADGRPSSRMVLLKAYDSRGFVFNTNSTSHKGHDIAATGVAALCFHWKSLRRQVRVEGRVELVSEAESDAYFATRPRGSQIGSWVSQQSQPLDSRETMVAEIKVIEERYEGKDVPRPPHWRGYRVVPERMEFWKQGDFRLHDRFVFTQDDAGAWIAQRMYP